MESDGKEISILYNLLTNTTILKEKVISFSFYKILRIQEKNNN